MKIKKSPSQLKKILTLIILIIALPIGVILSQYAVLYKPHAASASVNLSFVPGNLSVSPNISQNVVLDSGATPISYVDITITFDPSKVKLSNEITPTSQLKTVIKKTSLSDANKTGIVNVVLGLAPSDRSNPPKGTIILFTLPLVASSTNLNQSAVISFSQSDLQIVDMTANTTVITATSSTLNLNPASSPSLIQNPSFESSSISPWTLDVTNGTAAKVTKDSATKIDGLASARVDVTSPSSSAWSTQFFQNPISITSGTKYQISFWAKSETSKVVSVAVQQMASPYTQYFNQSISLTPNWQKYVLSFNPTVSNSNVKLTFFLAATTGSTWFDAFDFSPLSANLLKNPSFESALSTWTLDITNGTVATVATDTSTSADSSTSARVSVTSASSASNSWYTQLFQDNLSVISGKTYTISFSAKAQSTKTIQLVIQKIGSPYTQYFNQNLNLTTSWQNYSYTYTSSVSDSNVKLTLFLAGSTGTAWFDNFYFGF